MITPTIVRRLVISTAAGFALIVAMLPGTALAGPASHPPGAVAAGAAPAHVLSPAGSVPVRRSCAAPRRLGYVACQALVRTGAPAHQGTLAPGAAPQGYGPADLQSAYALPSATAGAGTTVAIIDAYDDPTAAADLAVYRKQFGLPPCTVANGCFRKIDQRGGRGHPPRDKGWSEEISLDLDMVSAACPQCHILLVEADANTVPDLGAAVNEAVAQGAKYISNSYSGFFPTDVKGLALVQRWDRQYYDHRGVVVAAASGDGGYDAGEFPAAFPQVVAVGGTSLVRDPQTARGWAETAWGHGASSYFEGGTGSGCDVAPFYAKPPWQHDSGCPGRTYNDVSAVADPATGVAVYDSYGLPGWSVFGGTSAATPLIAAVYALAGAPAGGTYPGSYPYAHPSALNDVTSGSNGSGCIAAYVCDARRGYDGPTGLGTPKGVAAFAAGPHGEVTGTVRDSAGAPVAGAQVRIGAAATYTDTAGRYTTTAVDGRYRPTAAKFGYATQAGAPVTVASNGTATVNFTLAKLPTATVSGTVGDASGHGWPLYAQIRVPGTPVVTYTNPVTGGYRISLPAAPSGSSYRLDVSAQYPGYRPSATTIHLGAAGLHQSVGLKIDALTCAAPGYRPLDRGLSENFNSGTTPAGWTVTNASGMPPKQGWVFNNPRHVGNYTGGTGGFAIADVATGGDSTLTTPVINLSGDAAPLLQFKQDLSLNAPHSLSNAEAMVSTDGGQTWSQAYTSSQSVPGPDTVLIRLPQAARQSRVQIKFDIGELSSWELDDVFVGTRACVPAGSGGLVVGRVRDHNTGQPVNGATVAGGGQQTVTAPEPGDPAVGGGLYWLPARSGPLALTATASGYTAGAAHVNVATGAVTRADVGLAAGQLAVRPAAVAVTEAMGGTRTARVQVTNTGSAPATVHLTAQAGPVTVAGQQPRASAGTAGLSGGAPLQRIRGHYSPRLGVGRAIGPHHRTRAAGGGAWVPPWAPAAHYPETIWDNAAATDPVTGDVYSVGGLDSTVTATSDGFVYQPATRSWSQLPAMPYTREAPAASVIGGKLYVTSGYDESNNVMQTALDIYDPHTRQWSPAAPIPHAGYGSASAVLDGKMYVIGGCQANGVCTYRYVQVYDPASNTWTQAAPYPHKISFLGCGAISGRLYCAGGFDHGLQTGTAAAYVYTPAANTWHPIASLPVGDWGGAEAAANGQLLVSGGVARFDQALTNQGYAYSPATNTWSALPNAPDPVYRGGAACGFYTIGGLDAAGAVASTAQLPGYAECDGGTGVAWLTQTPTTVTLAPGQHAALTLRLTASAAAVPQPGRYTATLTLNSGVPYPAVQLPVTLTAAPPHSWGEVAGTVSGKNCHGTTAPVDAATVQVNSKAGGQTLTTGTNGRYGLWLPATDSPLSLIATAPHWLAGSATARLTAGNTATVNIALKPASCG